MRATRHTFRGFTLIELLMVMMLLLIIASFLAPSLRGFIAGREASNAGTLVLSLANYARAQSASEGRAYRLNFDTAAHAIWLTEDNGGGTFGAIPSGDFGQRFQISPAVNIDVSVTPQGNVNLNIPQNVQQQEVQTTGQSISGQSMGAATTLMQNIHSNGIYVEFQSTGRADPASIKFTDRGGKVVEVACTSATDIFHILPAGAAR
ncbi:MAG: prepilin-type N-terminal cleavage/methylation domain-containing protein [Planctomycetota bacterium]|nr:prepilin-type N-terminal cleavage/methylation domain-containing protein [Planctomycetota bacterium]